MRTLPATPRLRLAFTLVFILTLSLPLHAEVPHGIIFQGVITDGSSAVPDGPYDLTFTIYDAAVGGTALWTSGVQSVPVTGGLFTYMLGSSVPLPDTLFDSDTVRYVGVQVEADPEMTPRSRLVSTAYAFHSRTSDLAYSGDLFRLIPVALPPDCDTSGRGTVYFDSSLNELCYCNGTLWVQVDGGGPCECVDADADGFDACDPLDPKDTDGLPADCNDTDPNIYPGAQEFMCDGIDQDCDGLADDDIDQDADGWSFCGGGDGCGPEPCPGDCDDTDPNVNPGAFDTPCDGFDQNCDGIDAGTEDADADGFTVCDGDCDDADASIYPGAPDTQCDGIDQDCSGLDAGAEDADADGWSICDGDCDDADASIYPGAPDASCDGVDQDCSGFDAGTEDADADGWSVCDGDCDDADASVYPGAPELCDGKDNNCDTVIDEGCI